MNLNTIGCWALAALGGLVFLGLVATEIELLLRALDVRQRHWQRRQLRAAEREDDGHTVPAADDYHPYTQNGGGRPARHRTNGT